MTATPRALTFVLAAAIVAGGLDIAYACLFWAWKADVPALRIFQSVAAGLLGRASFQGGAATAALGLALHFLIVLAMALAYWALARRAAVLVQRPVPCGAAYGLALYGVMNYIVLPLSAAPQPAGPQDPLWVVLSVLVHMGFVGIPIAEFTRRALRA